MAVPRAARTVTDQSPATPDGPTPRRFTVDEYYKMAEVGILGPDERVQLIEGKIVQMPPIGPRHAFNVDRLAHFLLARLGELATIRAQHPLRLARGAEPEPDVAVVASYRDAPRAYESRHPGPTDALLVVEVADSTLAFDLGEKAMMYALHGIADLWVVDLPDDRLVVHREPTVDGYAGVRTVARGETISPLAFPDVSFTVAEILG
jgi:Uma2 family endonuclease